MESLREQFKKTLEFKTLLELLFLDTDREYIIWLEKKLNDVEAKVKDKLANSLHDYIVEKHNQDECSGFIDGYKQAIEDIKNK